MMNSVDVCRRRERKRARAREKESDAFHLFIRLSLVVIIVGVVAPRAFFFNPDLKRTSPVNP